MPAIVAIVGRSKTGKTTLIEKLILALKAKGYTIGTVKNTLHRVEFDKQGSDTWRHMKAGSETTVLNSAESIFMVRQKKSDDVFQDIIKWFGNEYDLILLEGFKESDAAKILVHRKDKTLPISSLSNLVAIATDEKLDTDIPQYSRDDISSFTYLIEDLIKHSHRS
jgi:molybdopterin-guanine dinucleotide biosynthesis protein B